MSDIKQYSATPHDVLIGELLDSRVPKTEREHAAAREIEALRAQLADMRHDAYCEHGYRRSEKCAECAKPEDAKIEDMRQVANQFEAMYQDECRKVEAMEEQLAALQAQVAEAERQEPIGYTTRSKVTGQYSSLLYPTAEMAAHSAKETERNQYPENVHVGPVAVYARPVHPAVPDGVTPAGAVLPMLKRLVRLGLDNGMTAEVRALSEMWDELHKLRDAALQAQGAEAGTIAALGVVRTTENGVIQEVVVEGRGPLNYGDMLYTRHTEE